jgi:hypothetical protein
LIRENAKSDKYHSPYSQKTTLFGKKQLDLEGNIEQTAYNSVTVWNTAEVPRESEFPSIVRQGNFEAAKAARRVQRVKMETCLFHLISINLTKARLVGFGFPNFPECTLHIFPFHHQIFKRKNKFFVSTLLLHTGSDRVRHVTKKKKQKIVDNWKS